jgi:hypothetical protein
MRSTDFRSPKLGSRQSRRINASRTLEKECWSPYRLVSATAQIAFRGYAGSPGIGKTAIAKSIAIDLHGQRRLAASFFFDKSRNRPGTASLEMFVNTIASQLADFCPLYRSEIVRILSSNRAALN